ncbi:hypothetical protein G6O67_004638 [Ophiocordyceps sinensis]|uniref:Uncharacterized protein n=1 Tax=Ophiocordyceps sinensis TaxID=72228 RepID=A0A8H4PPW2_9HYPO|nr:hypothetical protein G6O67_004638 [Ophiocordyceps sinensis]
MSGKSCDETQVLQQQPTGSVVGKGNKKAPMRNPRLWPPAISLSVPSINLVTVFSSRQEWQSVKAAESRHQTRYETLHRLGQGKGADQDGNASIGRHREPLDGGAGVGSGSCSGG